MNCRVLQSGRGAAQEPVGTGANISLLLDAAKHFAYKEIFMWALLLRHNLLLAHYPQNSTTLIMFPQVCAKCH